MAAAETVGGARPVLPEGLVVVQKRIEAVVALDLRDPGHSEVLLILQTCTKLARVGHSMPRTLNTQWQSCIRFDFIFARVKSQKEGLHLNVLI